MKFSKFHKFILKRFISGLVGFVLIVTMYSALLNVQLDVTARAQITEMVQGYMMSDAVRREPVEKFPELKRECRERLERFFDLDKPLFARIISRAWKAVRFNFGQSKFFKTPYHAKYSPSESRLVNDIIRESLPATLILFVTTSGLVVLLAIFLGVKKAQRVNTPFDRSTTILTMIFTGTPSWWMGSMMIIFFVYYLELLPFGAMYSSPPPEGAMAMFFDRLLHMVLPVLSVLVVKLWGTAFIIKSLVLAPLQEDYITAARGRGLPERKVIFGHALRAASPAIVDMGVLSVVTSMGGDILLEKILAWPGIGTLLWEAIRMNDVPLMMGILTIITLLYCVSLFLLDLVYGILDPRIRH